MRSITEVKERQKGERNLTRLRELKSQEEHDRQGKENRSKWEKSWEIYRCREKVSWIMVLWGEREGTCEMMGMELL